MTACTAAACTTAAWSADGLSVNKICITRFSEEVINCRPLLLRALLQANRVAVEGNAALRCKATGVGLL